MAKKNPKKTSGAKTGAKNARVAAAKPTGKVKDSADRSPKRSEDKSSGPRGSVSKKPVGRVRTFFREVRVELSKVTWPTRKELIKSTGVVIVAVVIVAVFIFAFDSLWDFVVKSAGLAGSQDTVTVTTVTEDTDDVTVTTVTEDTDGVTVTTVAEGVVE